MLTKLFGDDAAFSAALELRGEGMTVPAKLAFDPGRSRLEMDMSEVKGDQVSPAMVAQIKASGLDKGIGISRPDRKLSYVIYPNL